MKRKDLITKVEKQLEEIGFNRGSWLWQPRSCQLILVIGSTLKAVSLKANMTQKALTFELGRIAGMAEAFGIIPGAGIVTAERPKANGHAASANGFNFGAVSEGFAGMPA